ncbi:MAG: SiaC family regulatory phosphoprotein [bacterium]
MATDTFTDRQLTLTVEDDGHTIRVEWTGRSIARDPGGFIAPILSKALAHSTKSDRPLVLDFTRIEYMNSSTITPIIRILDEAKRKGSTVTVLFKQGLKWQELSFSALEIFQTDDKRIEIRGVD